MQFITEHSINKPTIPAAQVNSDWNSSSGVSQILNKPTIPAAAGTLQTNLTAAQTTSSSEALTGEIKLHKVSKTGSLKDLSDRSSRRYEKLIIVRDYEISWDSDILILSQTISTCNYLFSRPGFYSAETPKSIYLELSGQTSTFLIGTAQQIFYISGTGIKNAAGISSPHFQLKTGVYLIGIFQYAYTYYIDVIQYT
jgi:hypothetical protein